MGCDYFRYLRFRYIYLKYINIGTLIMVTKKIIIQKKKYLDLQ